MFGRTALRCASIVGRSALVAGRQRSGQPALQLHPAAFAQPSASSSRLISTTVKLGSTNFNLNDYEEFQERVLESDTPVLVDFYANWCGPCKMLTPRLESIVEGRGGEVLLAKANVDEVDFAMDYEISAVPTVIAFKDGQPVAKFMGMKTDEEINAFLDEVCDQ